MLFMWYVDDIFLLFLIYKYMLGVHEMKMTVAASSWKFVLLATYIVVFIIGTFILHALRLPHTQCTVLKRLKDSEMEDATIEIVDEACQDGLPHTTTSSIIRMTERVWSGGRREEILRHERVHLSQKRNPDVWSKFYSEKWNYILYSRLPADIISSIPESDKSLLRPNPDTSVAPWAIWKSRYVFYPVYSSSGKHTLKDAPVHIWDIQEKSNLDFPPAEWINFFGNPQQYEHPHEISAEFLTDASKHSTIPAATKLFNWYNQRNVHE